MGQTTAESRRRPLGESPRPSRWIAGWPERFFTTVAANITMHVIRVLLSAVLAAQGCGAIASEPCLRAAAGASQTAEEYRVVAVRETGPDDSPVMRVQLTWPKTRRAVWTTLSEPVRNPGARMQARRPVQVRVCTEWGTPASACGFHKGHVEITSAVNQKTGSTLRGVLTYVDSGIGCEASFPFLAQVSGGRIP